MKKIIGYVLLIFGIFWALLATYAFPRALMDAIAEMKKDEAEGTGFLIGTLVGMVLIILLIFFIIKIGARLIRNHNKSKYV